MATTVPSVVREALVVNLLTEDLLRKSVAIAGVGIYDLRIHLDDVVTPVLRKWRVFELGGLRDDGNRARDELADFLRTLDAAANRFVERRAERAARGTGRR
jgi:acyl-[acyl-carrier-protein] desaturase